MSRKKRPVRDSAFVFIAGMVMFLTAIGFEARAMTTAETARCYALASASGNYAEASRLRQELKEPRKTGNDAITYAIGHTMGYLNAHADLDGVPAATLASIEFINDCKE